MSASASMPTRRPKREVRISWSPVSNATRCCKDIKPVSRADSVLCRVQTQTGKPQEYWDTQFGDRPELCRIQTGFFN